MKLNHLFLFVSALIFVSLPAASQPKAEEPLTRLPTIIVKGEDRSYLQIKRPPQIYYMPYRGEKRRTQIPRKFELPPREEFKAELSLPEVIPKTFAVTEVKLKKIPPLPFSFHPPSEDYRGLERPALPEVRLKEKFFAPLKEVKKELIHPPFRVTLFGKEAYFPQFYPSYPGVFLKRVSLSPPLYKKEISPEFPLEPSLRQRYVVAVLKQLQQEKSPLTIRAFEVVEVPEEGKTLIHPPLKPASIERVYFPEKIQKSEYPFLFLLVDLNDKNGFNYELDYGRSKESERYLLTMKRESSPEYASYQGNTLFREIDLISGGVSWGELGASETQIFLQGKQKILALPDPENGKRKDICIYASGKTSIFKGWKISIWGEKSTREDENTEEKKYDDFSYGVNLAVQPEKFPLVVEGNINWDNLRQISPAEESQNRSEAGLELRSLHPLSLGQNFSLDSAKIGVKGIKDKQAQMVGSLKLHWYGKEGLEAAFNVKKNFYLPSFATTYIPKDYSQVNLQLDAVNMTEYSLEAGYSRSKSIHISLRLFSQRGTDVMWIYTDSPEPRLYPQTVALSREGLTINGRWEITPSIIFEPSYTWKNVRNEQNPDKVIPHEPQSLLQAVLTLYLLKRETDSLSFEAEGEWLGESFYTTDPADTLDPNSRVRLKLTYRRKEWEASLGIENSNWFLSRDYKLPETKLSFGVKFKLF